MAVDHNNPQSRNEEILIATIDGKEYNKLPQSRIEELLLELKEVIEEGSGGGGINPIGVTTTPLYDGATTNPIQINGESYTAETGDMVTYQSTEFLFNVNEVWQELGDVSVVLAIIDDIFADIAPAFSATSTYAVGDYVIYDDQLYKCTTAHTGAWAAADFTATSLSNEIKNKQNVLTAGKYINIDTNNEISVNPVVPNESFTYRIYGNNGHHTVEKIVNGVVVHRENHESGEFDPPIIYDDAIKITYYNAGAMKYELLIPSDTHEAGYVQTWAWWNNIDFTETFSTVDHSGEKLITKSELDTALAGKQGVLTAGKYIKFEDDEISVKRLVLDGDEYTYDIYSKSTQTHVVVDKYDSNSTLVSTREYYMNDLSPAVEVDGSFTLYAYGGPWTCTLLVASKDHAAGYSFSSQWNVYTHYSETFELPPEESPNDLIIRSELNAVSEKLPAVPSTDGTYILTATVTNGEVVYSWESNNGLTQEQINALIALLD